LIVAGACLFATAAHADIVDFQVTYQDAQAGGCTARFMHRVTIYDGGIAGAPYSAWVKIADTCGLYAVNSTSNFAAQGFCTAGWVPFPNAHCSNGGYVMRTVYMWPNCGRQVVTQSTPATIEEGACQGVPQG